MRQNYFCEEGLKSGKGHDLNFVSPGVFDATLKSELDARALVDLGRHFVVVVRVGRQLDLAIPRQLRLEQLSWLGERFVQDGGHLVRVLSSQVAVNKDFDEDAERRQLLDICM